MNTTCRFSWKDTLANTVSQVVLVIRYLALKSVVVSLTVWVSSLLFHLFCASQEVWSEPKAPYLGRFNTKNISCSFKFKIIISLVPLDDICLSFQWFPADADIFLIDCEDYKIVKSLTVNRY